MNFGLLMNFFGGGGGDGGGGGSPWTMFLLLGAFGAVMYFTTIRPQKKRQKDEQAMRDELQIGDEITTLGGILGRIVTVKEDSLIIETGADRTKLRILRTAIHTNNTQQEKVEAEREAVRKAQEDERNAQIEEAGKSRKKSRKNRDEE